MVGHIATTFPLTFAVAEPLEVIDPLAHTSPVIAVLSVPVILSE